MAQLFRRKHRFPGITPIHRRTHEPGWVAQPAIAGKPRYVGVFDDEEEAARAADNVVQTCCRYFKKPKAALFPFHDGPSKRALAIREQLEAEGARTYLRDWEKPQEPLGDLRTANSNEETKDIGREAGRALQAFLTPNPVTPAPSTPAPAIPDPSPSDPMTGTLVPGSEDFDPTLDPFPADPGTTAPVKPCPCTAAPHHHQWMVRYDPWGLRCVLCGYIDGTENPPKPCVFPAGRGSDAEPEGIQDQLTRIEAKLDRVLEHLGLTLPDEVAA